MARPLVRIRGAAGVPNATGRRAAWLPALPVALGTPAAPRIRTSGLANRCQPLVAINVSLRLKTNCRWNRNLNPSTPTQFGVQFRCHSAPDITRIPVVNFRSSPVRLPQTSRLPQAGSLQPLASSQEAPLAVVTRTKILLYELRSPERTAAQLAAKPPCHRSDRRSR